ncbi:alpha/beta hydrolase [Micromonospora sp. BRA006-A]|nr:alpha/beta hydrolase [Micromonospora sp. BRA006-A]
MPGAVHLAGRGLWGLAWAIRHAVHRLRAPATRIAYGPDPDQWGDLRLPSSPAAGPAPVAVLLHGGFWRSIWGADLMDALAADLARRGYASWNLEYRRPDRHGWDATTQDVEAGLRALREPARDRLVDLDRIVVLGHSAGGQLALRAAADLAARPGGPRVALAVSLAGVLDLTEGERRYLGDGAVAAALGGSPVTAPRRYAESDPMLRLPTGCPHCSCRGPRTASTSSTPTGATPPPRQPPGTRSATSNRRGPLRRHRSGLGHLAGHDDRRGRAPRPLTPDGNRPPSSPT